MQATRVQRGWAACRCSIVLVGTGSRDGGINHPLPQGRVAGGGAGLVGFADGVKHSHRRIAMLVPDEIDLLARARIAAVGIAAVGGPGEDPGNAFDEIGVAAFELMVTERSIVRDQPIEDALAAASAALSGLSQAAGVVLAPKRELTLKQLSFVSLSSTRALAVLVGADGSVENRVVTLDSGTSAAALTEVSNFINARLSGLTLAEAEARLRAEIRERKEAIDAAAAELVASGLAAWSQDHARRPVLIVRGHANLIDPNAAEDLDRVRRLLDELEEAQEIAHLLESARDAPGCRIFIGSENRMFALSGSSVIAAPYRGSQGEVVGVVGVIGPTRLNYARVVPMVDFTAKALTRLMA